MTVSPDTARAWVDVDLDALVANARTIAAISGARLMPMVKANGYGLGAVVVAAALEPLEPWGFGVATLDEGAELRAAGVTRPIVVFTPLQAEWIPGCLATDLRPTIGDPAALAAWLGRTTAPFHLEIDTGMSRAGMRWDDRTALAAAADLLRDAPGWEGVFTHFHSAEDDAVATETQWTRFGEVLDGLPRRPPLVHAANSGGALRGSRYAADLVRPGIFLYGGDAGGPAPRPVAAFRTRVVAVRRIERGDPVSYGAVWHAAAPTTVATLAVGYADGVPRSAPAPRCVELGGRVLPIVGRVAMDMCMVAVDDGPVQIGDTATIWGGRISLDEQARAAGTNAYELLTRLGARLPRRYGAAG